MSVFINVTKMPHFVFSFAHIFKETQGGEPAQSTIPKSKVCPPATYRARDGCEGNSAAPGPAAGAVAHWSIRDTACGMQPGLTENSPVNTNVFKMADSVQE